MRNLRSLSWTVQFAFAALAVWISAVAPVFAKDAPGAPSAGEGYGAWVWAYMIVLLVVSLGMIVVCKSSGRRERAKPETYTEAKPLPREEL